MNPPDIARCLLEHADYLDLLAEIRDELMEMP